MRMLFCYDGPINEDKNGKYYSEALNDKMFQRYKCISDNINIAIRVRKQEKNCPSKNIEISKNDYKIIKCPNISSIKGFLFDKKVCKEILKDEILKSDFLVIRLPSVIGNLALKIAKKLNKPYLVELVGCPWDALWNYNIKGKIIAPYMTILTKNNVKHAPFVLYVTNEFLQKRYKTKGKNINCSNVILDDIVDDVLKSRIKRNNNNNMKELATIAATDVKYKGQKYVIKAISKLKRNGYNFKYHIIGNGDTTYLKKVINKYNLQNEVLFAGMIPHDKIFEYLDKIDIYIQPSKQEGLPRALIEAMSRACPCIGSKTGGIPELLDNKYIFPKGNVKVLEKILKNYSNYDMNIQSKSNFQKAKEYERNRLNKRREEFYKEFINENVLGGK